MLIRVALQMLFLVLGFAVPMWSLPPSITHALGRLTEPLLLPLRRVGAAIGGIDLSAFVLMRDSTNWLDACGIAVVGSAAVEERSIKLRNQTRGYS
jgi:hypothetical protein